MQIQTSDAGQPFDITIITVGLAVDSDHPERTFLLHCWWCGRELMQAQGKLTRLIPWLEPTKLPILIHGCSRCGERYTMQQTPMREAVLVRLNLVRESFCMICRLPVTSEHCTRCNTVYNFKN